MQVHWLLTTSSMREMDVAQRRGSWQPFIGVSQWLDQTNWRDLGLQYEFVGARQIEEGKLTRTNIARAHPCRNPSPECAKSSRSGNLFKLAAILIAILVLATNIRARTYLGAPVSKQHLRRQHVKAPSQEDLRSPALRTTRHCGCKVEYNSYLTIEMKKYKVLRPGNRSHRAPRSIQCRE